MVWAMSQIAASTSMTPLAIHRLGRVVAEIEHHLLDLLGRAGDGRGFFRSADDQLDPRGQRGMQQRGGLRDQRFHAHRLAPDVAAPAEGKDLIHEIARLLAGAADLGEIVGRAAAGRDLRLGHLRISQDRADDIVEVMRDAAGQRADRLHAPGLLQAGLQPGAVALQGLAPHGIAERVEGHAQQAELVGGRGHGRTQRIEAQDRLGTPARSARRPSP